MMQPDTPEDENERYRILVNAEEQYSLWRADLPVPAGWKDIGFEGTRDECSAHVDTIWTDMRPLSLRKRMANADTPAD
jgi:MbtH protein